MGGLVGGWLYNSGSGLARQIGSIEVGLCQTETAGARGGSPQRYGPYETPRFNHRSAKHLRTTLHFALPLIDRDCFVQVNSSGALLRIYCYGCFIAPSSFPSEA